MNCKEKSVGRLVTVMSLRMFCLMLVLAFSHTSFAVPVPNSDWSSLNDDNQFKSIDLDSNFDFLKYNISNLDGSLPKFDYNNFNFDIPTPPQINFEELKFPEYKYEEPISTPRYTYSHRIIFVPVGAIIFLISLCLRMCLCSSKKPTATPVTIVRRTVLVRAEANSAAQEATDQPPAYTDVQKEDPPPPYSEVTANTSPHFNPEVPQAATEPAASSVAEGTDAATSSASDLPSGDLTSSSASSAGRPKFLVSQYSYKPLK